MNTSLFFSFFCSPFAISAYKQLGTYLTERGLDFLLERAARDNSNSLEQLHSQLFLALDEALKLTCEHFNWEYDCNAIAETFVRDDNPWLSIDSPEKLQEIFMAAIGHPVAEEVVAYWLKILKTTVTRYNHLNNYIQQNQIEYIVQQIKQMSERRCKISQREFVIIVDFLIMLLDFYTAWNKLAFLDPANTEKEYAFYELWNPITEQIQEINKYSLENVAILHSAGIYINSCLLIYSNLSDNIRRDMEVNNCRASMLTAQLLSNSYPVMKEVLIKYMEDGTEYLENNTDVVELDIE